LSGHIFATLRDSSEVFQSCKNLQSFFRLEITLKVANMCPLNDRGFEKLIEREPFLSV
jgi:hypothetical protein